MSKISLNSSIVLSLFLLTLLVSCSSKKEKSEKEEALEALQFLSRMNSFPNSDVPADAFGRAYDYFKLHYKNTAAKNATNLLPWNNIGPSNNGGRTISIAIDPSIREAVLRGYLICKALLGRCCTKPNEALQKWKTCCAKSKDLTLVKS